MAITRSQNGKLPAKKTLYDEQFPTHLRRQRPLQTRKKEKVAKRSRVATSAAPIAPAPAPPRAAPLAALPAAPFAASSAALPAASSSALSGASTATNPVAAGTATSGSTRQASGVVRRAPRATAPSVAGAWPATLGRPRTRGMVNPAQWCYRRSVLQSLFSTPQFFNVLDSHVQGRCPGGNCVTCALRTAIRDYHSGMPTMGNQIMRLDQTIRRTGRQSSGWTRNQQTQEDAHDFHAYLIRTVKEARCTTSAQIQAGFQVAHQASWTCQRCGRVSTSTDPPSGSISVPINPRNGTATIQSCLDTYHTENGLEIRCDGCRSNIDRRRIKKIRILPEVLNLHLLRFAWTPRGQSIKLRDNVHIPDELDISRWAVQGSTRTKYRLQSMVLHAGGMNSGHYIARARNGNRVTEFDDTLTSTVQGGMLADLGSFTPYIVSYVRQP
ncbi:hypothetical protein KVT40_006178 [Elsinoe batatas]|uniref:USP domain-containing protein n=1 Tax=Elsinoe batatas TaxID=2601811 RepID=A0A8K0KYK4_9PEZI|nr:hypothetical protein KVT40_006178 [Elsinoe batatas]